MGKSPNPYYLIRIIPAEGAFTKAELFRCFFAGSSIRDDLIFLEENCMKNQNTRRLVESALMIAIGTVLSELKVGSLWAFGGGLTIGSMVPLVLISHRWGIKWGTFTAFVYSLLQLILGVDNVQYATSVGMAIAIILLDYICRTRLAQGTMPADPVAVTTIVSTDMATPVAKKYGVELRRTLTGFKFIGEQIGKLEAEGRPERYIFGFEESYGYLSGGHVRDKDAVNATLLVCEAAAWYAQQGKTLLDAIEALYREFGYYRNALCSFAFEGESGMHTMQELMKKLRANAPEDIAGYKVESVVDYDTDGTGLPRANVLEYHLDGGHKLMVRPSGTEPKIKVYLSAVGETEAAADAVNAALAKAAADMMKA